MTMIVKSVPLVALIMLLFFSSVNCEMRKSWSRKANNDDNDNKNEIKPLSTSDYLKYLHSNESELSVEKSNNLKEITTMESRTTIEIDATTPIEETIMVQTAKSIQTDNITEPIDDEKDGDVEDEDDTVEEEDETEDVPSKVEELRKSNTTENDQEIIKRGLRLIVLGRGKKNNWIERIVPLFILPYLIQSAFVPFIVQTIKLLLLKSLFVGKTALLLFVIGMFKSMKAERRSGAPYYLKEISNDGPDDRLYQPYGVDIAGYRSEDGNLVH